MGTKSSAHKGTRKRRFLAALDLAGLTQGEWAAREGISANHLYLVLHGKRESRSLIERIDAFADEQLASANAA